MKVSETTYCLRLGVLSDDAEWKRAVKDAFASSIRPLTELFAMILAYCEPADPKDIFDELKENFISDLQNRFKA